MIIYDGLATTYNHFLASLLEGYSFFVKSFEECPAGIIAIDMTGVTSEYINKKCLEIFNISHNQAQTKDIGTVLLAQNGVGLNNEQLKLIDYPIFKSIQNKEKSALIYSFKVNNTKRYISMSSCPILIGGRPKGAIAVIEDKTDSIDLRSKLESTTIRLNNLWRVSKNKLLSIKDVCDVALETIVDITKSKYGFYGFISDNEENMIIHAWSGETMKGCSVLDKPFVYPIKDAGVWAEAIRQRRPYILNDYPASNIKKKGYPDGHVKLTNMLVIPYFVGSKIQSVAAVANRSFDYDHSDIVKVSEFLDDIQYVIKEIESENLLNKSEEKYKRLVELMNEGVLVLNKEHVITYANNKVQEMLNLHTNNLAGFDFKNFIHQESVGTFLEQQALRSRGFSDPYELTLIDNQKNKIFILSSPLAILDDNNQLKESYEVITDISKIKAYENIILKEKDVAIFANKAKSEFLANMSHELRTPFNGIMTMLQLCLATNLTDEQNEYITLALTSTRKLLNLINDILDLARIERAKPILCINSFDLNLMLEDIMSLFQCQVKEKNILLTYSLEKTIPQILFGDEAKIRQIIFNLLGNAVKFTTAGEVSLQAMLLLNDLNNKIKLLFIITDTGCGIADESLRFLFKPFSQADSSYSRKYKGSGLGLSIVKNLVDLMGGTICLSSESNQGTEVYITLNLYCHPQADLQTKIVPKIPSYSNSGKSIKILLAEDEKINQLGIKKFIQKQDWSVDIAENGYAVLDLLSKNHYDLILMDIQMPEADGIETTKIIRASNHPYSQIPIIALTAHALQEDKDNFIEAGMDDYISKPVEFDELFNIIQVNLAKPKR